MNITHFAFKAFNRMLAFTLNTLFIIESGLYSMRFTNNFVRIICKSNIRTFKNVIIALNL